MIRASKQIPWSFTAEDRLRSKIQCFAFLGWFSFIATALATIFAHGWKLPLGCVTMFVVSIYLANRFREQLGEEEFVWKNTRYAGSGMLANKPKDTSRLTNWRRFPSEWIDAFPETLHCPHCIRAVQRAAFNWIPNVAEDTPGIAIDPQGGRYTYICECGRGYYMLKEPPL